MCSCGNVLERAARTVDGTSYFACPHCDSGDRHIRDMCGRCRNLYRMEKTTP